MFQVSRNKTNTTADKRAAFIQRKVTKEDNQVKINILKTQPC